MNSLNNLRCQIPYICTDWALTQRVCNSNHLAARCIKYTGIGVVCAVALDIITVIGLLFVNAAIALGNISGLYLFIGPRGPKATIQIR